jgi:putative phosphonate metabolism protein
MRYAIYYLPPPGHPVTELGQDWLGRDVVTGAPRERVANEALARLDVDLDEITGPPRHYGFHATLKAPFALAPGTGEDELRDALARFAKDRQPFAIDLTVGTIGPFITLLLARANAPMGSLADDVVRVFDRLRAPLTEEEVARRNPDRLSERQRRYLDRWGYPYVFEDFQFHMTLTGSVRDPALHAALIDGLADLFGPALAAPVPVDRLSLFAQPDRQTPFTLIDQAPLGA